MLGALATVALVGWWSVEQFTKEEVVVSSVGGLDSRESLHGSIDFALFWLGAYSVAWRCGRTAMMSIGWVSPLLIHTVWGRQEGGK